MRTNPYIILHIISSLGRGGSERQLATIVANSYDALYNNRIVIFRELEKSYVSEYDLSDKVFLVEGDGFFSRLIGLRKLFIKVDPDVVYTWGNIESILTMLLKPCFRFKFINGSVRHGIRSRDFSQYFRTLVLHLSRNVVANSYAGLRANNLNRGFVLYNGIDPKFLRNSHITKTELKASLLGVNNNDTILVSLANLVPYKDYFTVLKALVKIKNEDVRFKYYILGEGPMREDIQKFIEDWGLVKEVSILGNIQDVKDHLAAADIFIHSSKGEGCSNAILEAMASGLPIIASNTGGTNELVKNNGFLFQYGNSDQLYTYILDLLQHPVLAREMGEESKKLVQENFTVSEMKESYYKIIRNIISA